MPLPLFCHAMIDLRVGKRIYSWLKPKWPQSITRNFSSEREVNTSPVQFSHSRLHITMTKNPRPMPTKESLVFGQHFSDHMLQIHWDESEGWSDPQIVPYGPLSLYPSVSVLNYGTGIFEGLKAYKLDKDSPARLFRPLMNMERMLRSSQRLALPSFEPEELLKLIKELVKMDIRWIPEGIGYSLYIRPLLFGTHVRCYYKDREHSLCN